MARPKKINICHPDLPYYCKGLCQKCYKENYYQQNLERIQAARKDYVANNYAKVRDSQKRTIAKNPKAPTQRAETWKTNNPIKARDYKYRKFGWSVEKYETAFIEQGGMCAICKRIVEGLLCTDHDHTDPPTPRGLLCNSCNLAIGMLQDNSSIVESAAAYLKKFGK